MQNLLLFILIFPLLSFAIICISGRYLGVYGSMLLSVINMGCALLCSITLFLSVSFNTAMYVEL